jgi:hypothetical protein
MRVTKKPRSNTVRLRGCLKSPLVGIKYFYPTLTLPDILGRGLDFPVSPQYIGGLRGVTMQLKSQQTTFQTTSKIPPPAATPLERG